MLHVFSSPKLSHSSHAPFSQGFSVNRDTALCGGVADLLLGDLTCPFGRDTLVGLELSSWDPIDEHFIDLFKGTAFGFGDEEVKEHWTIKSVLVRGDRALSEWYNSPKAMALEPAQI